MLRWRRRHDDDIAAGPSSPTVVCHFCSTRLALASNFGKGKAAQRLPVVPGSWSSFKCSVCQSWNLRNPSTGKFVQDARIYSDPSLNPPRTARPEGPFAAAPSFVFCSDCQTNQQLQLQLLAGYLPPNVSLQEEEQRLKHLEAYKASLDERYPVVCEHCAERVEHIIEERNLKAKARTVGGWLKRSTVESMHGRSDQPKDHIHIWRLKAFLWHLQYGATAAICTDRALQDYSYSDKARIVPLPSSLNLSATSFLSISLAGLLWSFWDPTYLARKQHQIDVHGQGRWRALQALLLASRVLLSLLCVFEKSLPSAVWGSVACTHVLLLLLKNRIIHTTGPRRIRLVQRSLPASPQKHSVLYDTALASDRQSLLGMHNPVFGQSSFGPSKRKSSPQKQVASSTHLANSQPMDMDWQPTKSSSAAENITNSGDIDMLETAGQGILRDPLRLRPAVFNPSNENWHENSLGAIRALERLFATGVTLSEPAFTGLRSPTRDRSIINRSGNVILCAGVGTSFAALVALYLRWKAT